MRARTPTLLAFALFNALACLAQVNPVVITGRVVDARSGEAIPYAHVGIAAKGIGTTTGYDGRFELKVPRELQDSEFSVSFIGYETYRRRVRDLRDGATIQLAPAVTGLTEVVVMDREAILNIIRRAVAAIPDNYPTAPSNSLAFYRESLTDDSLRYRYLAEGVLRVYKTSYENTKEGQVGLVQGRKVNLRDPLDTTISSIHNSGHMAAHRFDFVKNREDFIDEALFPVYQYRLERMTTYNDKPVYVIAFSKDPEANSSAVAKRRPGVLQVLGNIFGGDDEPAPETEARLEGRVFIEKDSYAFIRAEFEVTKEGLKRYNDYPLYAGHWNGNRYTVNYRKSGSRWYFSDALREGERPDGGHYTNEVKTTELVAGSGNPVPYLERMTRDDRFVELTGRYSPDFWRDYNVLPMSEGLADGMRQFETMRLAQAVFGEAYQDSLRQVRDSIATAKRAAEMAADSVARDRASDWVFSDENIDASGSGTVKVTVGNTINSKLSVRAALGFGPHVLSSGPQALSIAYRDGVGNPLLARDGTLDGRDFELIMRWDLDLVLHKNAFVRYSSAFDFSNNIYRDRAIGLGLQSNLRPRHRPIILRAVAQYGFFRYYRTLGKADFDGKSIEVAGAKFKGDRVRLGYGSNQHNLNLTAELAVETRRKREVYLRATYHHNLASNAGVWFKETGQVFRKDKRLAVDDEQVTVRSNESIVETGTWSVAWVWR